MLNPFHHASQTPDRHPRNATLSPLADRRRYPRRHEVRRRPDRTQARALDVLAHALEYLVDSASQSGRPPCPGTIKAVQLLAEKSRAVFAECPAIIPLSQRLLHLLPRVLTLPPIENPDVLSHMHRASGDTPHVRREGEW